jgi:hypothetical protein
VEPHIDELAELELFAILQLLEESDPKAAAFMLDQFLAHVHVIQTVQHSKEKI